MQAVNRGMFLSVVTKNGVTDNIKCKINSQNLCCRSVINPISPCVISSLSSYVISKILRYLICRLPGLTLLQEVCLSCRMISR
jgi:hypothetical protein